MCNVSRDLADGLDAGDQPVERLVDHAGEMAKIVAAHGADPLFVVSTADLVQHVPDAGDTALVDPRDRKRQADRKQQRDTEAPAHRGQKNLLVVDQRTIVLADQHGAQRCRDGIGKIAVRRIIDGLLERHVGSRLQFLRALREFEYPGIAERLARLRIDEHGNERAITDASRQCRRLLDEVLPVALPGNLRKTGRQTLDVFGELSGHGAGLKLVGQGPGQQGEQYEQRRDRKGKSYRG